MKLAIRREIGSVPGGGYHYFLFPAALDVEPLNMQSEHLKMVGHIIIEVDDKRGEELLADSRIALKHQCEIAILADKVCPP